MMANNREYVKIGEYIHLTHKLGLYEVLYASSRGFTIREHKGTQAFYDWRYFKCKQGSPNQKRINIDQRYYILKQIFELKTKQDQLLEVLNRLNREYA